MKNQFMWLVIIIWCIGSIRLILSLWKNYKKDKLNKKIIWTIILCVPGIGWIFYGGFYKAPGINFLKAKGKASGWAPHYPPPFGESELDEVRKEITSKNK